MEQAKARLVLRGALVQLLEEGMTKSQIANVLLVEAARTLARISGPRHAARRLRFVARMVAKSTETATVEGENSND